MGQTAGVIQHDDKSDIADRVLQLLRDGRPRTTGALGNELDWAVLPLRRVLDDLRQTGVVESITLKGQQQQVLWTMPTVLTPVRPELSMAEQRRLMVLRGAAVAMARDLVPYAHTQTQLAVALWLLGQAELDPKV